MRQGPVLAGTQDYSAKLAELRAKSSELKLHIEDLRSKASDLAAQRTHIGADVSRPALDKQIGDVEHQIAASSIQLEAVTDQIKEVQDDRDMARAFSLQAPPAPPAPTTGIATTASPVFEPFIDSGLAERGMFGVLVLMVPIVIALTRRIWRRSAPRVVDIDDSPRLQRIEQAIEAIAVEVERIGEAQRFTTKLLAERQPEPAPRVGVQSRREPGVITPH